MNNFTEADIEIGKLFDSLTQMKLCRERFYNGKNKQTVEIDGEEYDAESIAEGILLVHMRRFRELVDMSKPVYSDFIRGIEQMPGMDVALEKYEQFKATEMRATG